LALEVLEGKRGEYILHTFHAEVTNGESITGEQYLHGTNANVGDFTIMGKASVRKEGQNTVVTMKLTYGWHDIMDPNPGYSTDIEKADFGEFITFGYAESYVIHIYWTEEVEVVFDANNRVVSEKGWPLK
jgi:hypothetical protein